jgi:hypothetical protein
VTASYLGGTKREEINVKDKLGRKLLVGVAAVGLAGAAATASASTPTPSTTSTDSATQNMMSAVWNKDSGTHRLADCKKWITDRSGAEAEFRAGAGPNFDYPAAWQFFDTQCG